MEKDRKKALDIYSKNHSEIEAKLDNIKVPEIKSIMDELAEAEYTNERYRTWKDHEEKLAQIENLESEVKRLGDEVANADVKIKEIMAESEFPIKELEISEDGLLYKGLPFDETSLATSELIDVGVKLAIAKKPNTKIIRIPRGESLGKEKLDLVCKYAEKHGYQLFIERVTEDEKLIVKIVE